MPGSPFLNNYIQSLSTKQQQTVASMMQLSIDAKTNLQILASNLGSTNFSSFVPVGQAPGARISGNDWFLNFRNINLLINNLFTALNQVGLLLDTNQKILLSQLAAAEKQLSALEKQATNFEFLLGTGNSYNYAYTETFHDILGQAINLPWTVPDRDGLGFDPNSQQATVLPTSGELILPQNASIPGAGLSVELVKSNGSGFVTSDTGVDNILNPSSATGWSYTISAPNPITADIDPIFGPANGSQVILEFTLSQPSSCSRIQLVPLASETIQLLDIIAYESITDRVGFSLQGTDNVTINQTITVSFPLTTIQRFRLYLNQPEYTRILSANNQSEVQFNRVYNQSGASNKSITNLGYDKVDFGALAESMGTFPSIACTGLNTSEPDICDLLRVFKTKLGPQTQWTQPNPNNDFFLHLYSEWPGVFKTIFQGSTHLSGRGRGPIQPTSSITNNALPATNAFPTGTVNPTTNSQYSYQYVMGLQSVNISVSIPEYKGVFVSNIIPSPGDMGVVVMHSTYSNYLDTIDNLDNPVLTSVEFSVTNKSTPVNESDWISILALDDVMVSSERLFPNASGSCSLRFIANAAEPMHVYRNGFTFISYTQQLDSTDNNVVGINLLPKTYAPQDVMTVAYTPVDTSNVVNFAALGFGDLPLLSASDNNGAGEGFTATVGGNIAQIQHIPFVDTSQLNNSSYQPITIVLFDGTVATNLTDYITGVQPAFPSSGYYYIQTGNTLLFNQPISQPFRVYYQYLQNNVRFRTVLRSNSVNLVSPIVNLIQIKAETRLPNAVQAL